MENLLDFNNADKQQNEIERLDIEAIRGSLLNRLEDALFYLFPNGHIRNNCFHIGSTKGEAGKSLIVQLGGDKQGNWFDFATNQGGDIFSLWEETQGYQKSDFNKLLTEINEWLGNATTPKHNITRPRNFTDNLGKPTAKWDYFDRSNKLIACVYRYDTEDGKEFRVWDVKNRKAKSPDPRPLYNIPGIISAKKVILVEGEKSADALIAYGLTASTAMFGANAPINKTDWSPLIGKEVIIWPDNDEAGKEYAQKVAKHLLNVASFVSILNPSQDKAAKWDAADAVLENFDIRQFLETARSANSTLPSYSIADFVNDDSPMPDDIIMPRLLTPGGMLLIGGAPKVGKSDFLINFLIHLAAGEGFLGLKPPRPLKIFYLQAEIGYHYMRERIKKLAIAKETFFKASQNLIATSRIQMILNDQGVDAAYRTIKHYFPNQAPDIICIDPIRNVFDGGSDNGSENDNNAMLFFLQNRIEKLRSMLNPEMGIILCHHTKKIKKKDVEEDPFQAFSGAGSLRSFYSSGLILHRPNEYESKINLYFELRNGSAIPKKIVEKENNKWVELNPFSERLIRRDYGDKLDAERDRKADVILELIGSEALSGNIYTAHQFSERFENKAGLGCIDSISKRISVLATKGYIRFSRNWSEFGLNGTRSKYGILCVQNMKFTANGAVKKILPTHFKCPNIGSVLEVENPEIWPIYEEENA
jgi:5S rRNA maturation endonuclease (ribonuclease M5)